MNSPFSKIILFTAFAGASLHAEEYTCVAKAFREHGNVFERKVESRFVLNLKNQENGQVKAEKIAGHVTIVTFDEGVAEKPADNYYAVFALKDQLNNPNYRPRVYQNHVQFKAVNATETNSVDGGGMWGQLVVNKTRSNEESFDAHYIFQAGDHLGGTIDYDCASW
jgi:hypothetical protein